MSEASKTSSATPPRSRVNWWDPFLILGTIACVYAFLGDMALSDMQLLLLLAGAVILVMGMVEYWRSPTPDTKRPNIPFEQTFRTAAKKAAVVILLTLGMFTIWVAAPLYIKPEYAGFEEAIAIYWPAVPFVIFLWVLWTEWRLGPSDDYVAKLVDLLFNSKVPRWISVRDGLMGWLILTFFFPLNFYTANFMIDRIRGHEGEMATMAWPQLIDRLDIYATAIYMIATMPGFLFAARILGTSFKKVEHTWFGWVTMLLCYRPVFSAVNAGWFVYSYTAVQVSPWVTVFGDDGVLAHIVGLILILLFFIRFYSESIFGLRISHLANRGIVTNGFYRFCKHPSYISSCVIWFLIYLPFLSGKTILVDVIFTIGFLGLCWVYAARAWVEERLLSSDPDYVAYALWMDKHSWFSWLGRRYPSLTFANRLQGWNKHRQKFPDEI